MITGVGTDLVEVARMQSLLERWGPRLGQRLLAPAERERLASAADPARFLAKRFAAKEAFGKALGTGIRAPVLLPEIAVEHDALGKPAFAFAPALAAHLAGRGLTAHLSISDERDYAVAFVVLESP